MLTYSIEKTLSANDTGETGGHQAGILVPKDERILNFFPRLDPAVKNPRVLLDVTDDTSHNWVFAFIYYNNRFFGGTRNEYRLTGMTAYFREFNLKTGDKIILHQKSPRNIHISFVRAEQKKKVLKLTSTWKIINADF